MIKDIFWLLWNLFILFSILTSGILYLTNPDRLHNIFGYAVLPLGIGGCIYYIYLWLKDFRAGN